MSAITTNQNISTNIFIDFIKGRDSKTESLLEKLLLKKKVSYITLKKYNIYSFEVISRLFLGLLFHNEKDGFKYLINVIPKKALIENSFDLISAIMLNNTHYYFGKEMCRKIIHEIKIYQEKNKNYEMVGVNCPLRTAILLEELELADELVKLNVYDKSKTKQKYLLYTVMKNSNPKVSVWFDKIVKDRKIILSNDEIAKQTLNVIGRSCKIEKSGEKWLELNEETISNYINNEMKTQGYVTVNNYDNTYYITETGRFNDGFNNFLSTKDECDVKAFINIFKKNINSEKHLVNNIKRKDFKMANYLLDYVDMDLLKNMDLNFDNDDFDKLTPYPKLKSMISKRMLLNNFGHLNKLSRERIM